MITFKVFFVEKIIPNFFVWTMAYIAVGRLIATWFPSLPLVDWTALVDVASLLVFLCGVVLAIVLAYLFAKGSAQLTWFFHKVREEASTALVNLSSIALIVGLDQLASPSITGDNTISLLVLPLFGFLLAWRAL